MKEASIYANSYAIPGRYPIKELKAKAKRKAKAKAKALRAGFCITAEDASRTQL